MAKVRALPPVWLMGAGFLPLGISGGLMLINLPQLLAANHVPEPTIAGVEALFLIPGFVSFLVAPLLDWRYSRRTYAVWLTVISAICVFGCLMSTHNLPLLMVLLFATNMAVSSVVSAVGGWFGNIVTPEKKNALGAWFTVFNIGAGGVVTSFAMILLRGLPFVVGAGLLSLLMLSALPLFWWTPCPPADGRLASESFREFARDVLALLRRSSVLWTLLIFLAPSASFALTNVLGGLGHDYGTSEKLVGLLGGAGAAVAGVVGSLLVPQLAKKIPPRPLYLVVGLVGAAFSLGLIAMPRTSTTFGLAMLGQNVFQAAAFAVANVITLRSIGEDNPLAATQFGLLTGATIIPLTYMQAIDGQAYGLHGAAGSFFADGAISGAACLALALVLWAFRKRVPAA
jgi:PAT family beta-lactamase induction signal transducer AmpG